MRFLPLLPGLLVAGATLAPPLAAQSGRIAYESFALPNGLRVLYSEDRSAPIVTVDLWYYVGARNERPGRGGFAHLFEHMMFQGSANVPRGEHFKLVTSHGGTLNGTTSADRTNYFEMLPSGELAGLPAVGRVIHRHPCCAVRATSQSRSRNASVTGRGRPHAPALRFRA